MNKKICSDGYLLKSEVADRCRRSERTIEVWMRSGKIPFLKIGRSTLFDWEAVRDHFQQHYGSIPKPTRRR